MKRPLFLIIGLCFAILCFARTEVYPTMASLPNDSTEITGQITPETSDTVACSDFTLWDTSYYCPRTLSSSIPHSELNADFAVPYIGINAAAGPILPRWLVFSAETRDYPGLMRTESGSIGISVQSGKFVYDGYAGAIKYGSFNSLITSYYVGGQVTYSLNPNLSMTVFGTYFSRNPYLGMAAFPYVRTTNFGGYMTISPNSSFSLSLGAKSYYDPFGRRMEIDPIIAPSVKVGKVRVGVDVGHAAKHYIRSLFQSWSR